MRVLLIVHGYPPDAVGGTEIYTRDLAEALASRSDVEVFVLTRAANPRVPDGTVRHELREGIRIAWINNTLRVLSIVRRHLPPSGRAKGR